MNGQSLYGMYQRLSLEKRNCEQPSWAEVREAGDVAVWNAMALALDKDRVAAVKAALAEAAD